MDVRVYLQPARTFLPCTGAGRYINAMVGELATRQGVNLDLLCSRQWLGTDGKLPGNCPLRGLPVRAHRFPENPLERVWKVAGFPSAQRWFEGVDWAYSPSEVYLPRMRTRTAVTVYDVQALEPDLPWSKTREHQIFRRKWSAWIPKLVRDCDIVFTLTEFSKRRIVELAGADPRKVVVTGCGVDAGFFDSLGEFPAATRSEPSVLVIGGLRLKKGAEHVLGVARALHQRGSKLRIVVIGDNEPEYKAQAEQLSTIELLGRQSDARVIGELKAARALLFLSLYEGFGIPAIEAMACGTPVVASTAASLPEVVAQAGVVLRPEAYDEIADTLIQLDNDPVRRASLIAAGHVRAREFPWSSCVDRVLEVFSR